VIECLGYKTRNLCSHVIAVAFYKNQLQEFLSKFKVVRNKRSPNLTALTTFGVIASAGKKRPAASRSRRKSPDPKTSVTNTEPPPKGIIADVLSSDSSGQYTAEASSNPLRITIHKGREAYGIVNYYSALRVNQYYRQNQGVCRMLEGIEGWSG